MSPSHYHSSETQRKRSVAQRMVVVHGFLLICLLIIVARLIELQVVRFSTYHELAQAQHYGGVVLPAKRGEILSRNSKTGETSIFATNTTLDMIYVDPLIVDSPTYIAETLADTLLTQGFHDLCTSGSIDCPRELVSIYKQAFDPLARVQNIGTGVLLEPTRLRIKEDIVTDDSLPDLTEARRQFARNIEKKISNDRVTYIPLVYSATKVQMKEIDDMNIHGITVLPDSKLIYANPEEINQLRASSIARKIASTVQIDVSVLRKMLRSRPLRYVPILRRLPPELSSQVKELQLASIKETKENRVNAPTREAARAIQDPLRSIALIPEHWRFYPDGTVGSQVVGFLNVNQEAQYGIERTFNPQLKGQEGLISSVSDPHGGQIVTNKQSIVDAQDGDTLILTIDRFIQKQVEQILQDALIEYEAEAAQSIIMDPFTGKVIAMASAPLFDSNNYGTVYEREPIFINEKDRNDIVVEIIHPESNAFVLRGYMHDIFTEEGRLGLSEEKQAEIGAIETLYDINDVVRYYEYIGENHRREIFPTANDDVWLTYKNTIGVGAYLNRSIQSIYEPGSVLKPITIAVAIDQGEIAPSDTYDDNDPVEVDEYTIRNALNAHYGTVTMTNCLEYSINTCMTTISTKLGKKLFQRMLERFGFGRVTGIELEDEQPGEVQPWKKWSNALLATSAYGQGISATPLQVVTAFSALANGGKLMRPTLVDSVIHTDGSVEKTIPQEIDQVITQETSSTITAMLTSTVSNGFARTAKVPGHRIAGKTGTSQIAGPGGKYETGTGSTITSFAGYAPIEHPRFVIFVKFDRPEKVEFGSESAAPVFKKIASFLFEYYGIPPDDDDL